jgi:uncharacterized membrane protein
MSWHPYLWHPILVHFTVALLSAGTLFLAIAWMTRTERRQRLAIAGEFNLWLGVGLTLVTVATGWLAFETVPHDDDAVHEMMEVHRNLGLGTLALFSILAGVSAWHRRHRAYPSAPFVVGLAAGIAALALTGWRGGQLVFERGVGVDRPRTEAVEGAPKDASAAKDDPRSGQSAREAKDKTAEGADDKAAGAHHHHHHHDHPH